MNVKTDRSRVLIPCAHCKGRGKLPLPELQEKILLIVVRLEKASAEDVMRELHQKIARTTMNNRLARLYARGLLTRTRARKVLTYVPTKLTLKKVA